MKVMKARSHFGSRNLCVKQKTANLQMAKKAMKKSGAKKPAAMKAMKVAKEQALVRERAADYVRDGREVPGDLMQKYRRTIANKLDPGGRQRAARQRSQQSAPISGDRAGG